MLFVPSHSRACPQFYEKLGASSFVMQSCFINNCSCVSRFKCLQLVNQNTFIHCLSNLRRINTSGCLFFLNTIKPFSFLLIQNFSVQKKFFSQFYSWNLVLGNNEGTRTLKPKGAKSCPFRLI